MNCWEFPNLYISPQTLLLLASGDPKVCTTTHSIGGYLHQWKYGLSFMFGCSETNFCHHQANNLWYNCVLCIMCAPGVEGGWTLSNYHSRRCKICLHQTKWNAWMNEFEFCIMLTWCSQWDQIPDRTKNIWLPWRAVVSVHRNAPSAQKCARVLYVPLA